MRGLCYQLRDDLSRKTETLCIGGNGNLLEYSCVQRAAGKQMPVIIEGQHGNVRIVLIPQTCCLKKLFIFCPQTFRQGECGKTLN